MSNSAPMTNPNRILIAISGFLQEGKDGDKAWQNLIEHANSKNIGTFIFGWKASSKKKAMSEVLTLKKAAWNLFPSALKESKIAGKLLACMLASRVPFLTQAVSLVGHSLGCQVIK